MCRGCWSLARGDSGFPQPSEVPLLVRISLVCRSLCLRIWIPSMLTRRSRRWRAGRRLFRMTSVILAAQTRASRTVWIRMMDAARLRPAHLYIAASVCLHASAQTCLCVVAIRICLCAAAARICLRALTLTLACCALLPVRMYWRNSLRHAAGALIPWRWSRRALQIGTCCWRLEPPLPSKARATTLWSLRTVRFPPGKRTVLPRRSTRYARHAARKSVAVYHSSTRS